MLGQPLPVALELRQRLGERGRSGCVVRAQTPQRKRGDDDVEDHDAGERADPVRLPERDDERACTAPPRRVRARLRRLPPTRGDYAHGRGFRRTRPRRVPRACAGARTRSPRVGPGPRAGRARARRRALRRSRTRAGQRRFISNPAMKPMAAATPIACQGWSWT